MPSHTVQERKRRRISPGGIDVEALQAAERKFPQASVEKFRVVSPAAARLAVQQSSGPLNLTPEEIDIFERQAGGMRKVKNSPGVTLEAPARPWPIGNGGIAPKMPAGVTKGVGADHKRTKVTTNRGLTSRKPSYWQP